VVVLFKGLAWKVNLDCIKDEYGIGPTRGRIVGASRVGLYKFGDNFGMRKLFGFFVNSIIELHVGGRAPHCII
jgi:hypothetical protein